MDNSRVVKVYPNPVNEVLHVEVAPSLKPWLTKEAIIVEIINSLGQVVCRNHIIPQNGRFHKEIDLGGVANGVYIIKVSGEGVRYIQRFVKE